MAGQRPGRANQRHRTRKDLLAAAARLLKAGCRPSIEEVAEEALVSRATAYRYFPNIEALLIEAPLDLAVPDPDLLFEGDRSRDPVARMTKAGDALHQMIYKNEAPLRLMLAHAISRGAQPQMDGATPLRQNRRTPLIEAALAPARERFSKADYKRLCAALALILSTESLIIFKDVLQMDEGAAREVKRWATQVLVDAALAPQG